MTISTEVAGQMKYESVFAGHRCPMCGGEVREGIQEAIREDVLADPLVGCSCLGKCQWAGRLSECVKVEDCVKALRAVNAHLAEFCDNGRPFHVMAVEAARRTIKDLEYVRRKHEWLKSDRAFHEGSTEAADGLQKKAQEYERQVQKRLDAINGYYFGMIQDLRCERDEQIETVHKLNEEIDRLKKESAENTNRFLDMIQNIEMQTLKELRAASCEHSCVKRMVFGSSNEPELIPLSDKDVAKNWDTLEMILNQHVKCSVSDDALTLKINLNSDAAPNAEKMPARSSCEHSCMAVQDQVVEIQSLHKEIDRLNEELSGQIAYKEQNRLVIQERNKTIQERDQEIKQLKGRVEALECDIGVMSQDCWTAVLALQEVDQAQKETIQNQCIEIQRMKGRLYVFENTPFDNWVKRAEKAEVELEKIKEYARRWTEAKCEDPNCEFCSKRPENPLN